MTVGIQRPQRREVASQLRVRELVHQLRSDQVLQLVRPQIDQPSTVRESIEHQLGGGPRHDHLPTVGAGPKASATVQRGAAVVAFAAEHDLTGVDGHPHPSAAPSGHGSACNARWASRAAAMASEGRSNAATTESPSPCSTGRAPP